MTATHVKIWLFREIDGYDLHAGLVNRLDPVQQQRFMGLSSTRKKTFCFTRLLLAYALERSCGIAYCHWLIQEREALPPVLIAQNSAARKIPVPVFSISHSADTIAIAIATPGISDSFTLGLDIETNRPNRKIETADYFCNAKQLEEMISLSSTTQKRQYITRLWTQKEAYFKAYQQPVLNPQLKPLLVSRLESSQGRMQTTSLDESTEISIYCGEEFTCECHVVCLNESGQFKLYSVPDFEWQNYQAAISQTKA